MIVIKILYFLIYNQICFAYPNKYCEICSNHTLCKFQDSKPSRSCIGYEKTSMLNQDQIKTIVDQINKRRNLIALGQSNFFYAAANMKKIVWSDELAVFAQRWVDQCDQSLKPDLEDQCRDMEKTKVGQNIATITGLTPGFNIKSYVEIWFILSMDYGGSVTYYNQSQDNKTKYFTQLIWANTDKVGCGKAKFYIKNVKVTLVERLVCNFAPAGNVHGKPVYIIGYPATQCDDGMKPDDIFTGLCSYDTKTAKLFSVNTVATSLLRIRNPFDDMSKHEIDPIHSITQTTNSSEMISSYPKKHNIFREPSNDAIKRSYLLQNDNTWTINRNISKLLGDFLRQQEKGHSKLYRSHNHKDEYDYLHPTPSSQDSRKYYTPSFNYESGINYKYSNNKQCTRKINSQRNNDDFSKCNCKENILKCTRRSKSNWQMYTRPYRICSDSTSNQNINSPCTCGVYTQKYTEKQITSNMHSQVTTAQPFLRLHKRKDKNYDYSDIKQHFTKDESNFKPFWEMEGFKGSKQVPPLKALLYTTLLNKKMPRSRHTKSSSRTFTTIEPITMKNIDTLNKNKHLTEKYLSFDELMHLRKYNAGTNNVRRFNDDNLPDGKDEKAILRDAATTTLKTEEYTANTPYIRLKYCTRKLTCTWTAASLTDSSGSVINGNNIGSRTPPGYVEGCTRTSTCTRDFMDRNKMDTLTFMTTTTEMQTDDEDYCERRSLNKRNINENYFLKKLNNTIKKKPNLNDTVLELLRMKYFNKCDCLQNNLRNKRHNSNGSLTVSSFNYRKRKSGNINRKNAIMSYGDLYYLVLNKILGTWKSKSPSSSQGKCPCNASEKQYFSILLLFITLLVCISN